jgi:hypothetical protein
MRHNIEIGTGEYLDNLTVNAAALLDDVVQALELTEGQAKRVLGNGYTAVAMPDRDAEYDAVGEATGLTWPEYVEMKNAQGR